MIQINPNPNLASNPEYFRLLVESCIDPIFVVNPQSKVILLNENMAQLIGGNRMDLLHTDFFVHFKDQKIVHELFLSIIEKGVIKDAQLSMICSDGSLINVFLNGSVYRDNQHEILGVIFIASYIHEKKKYQENLNSFLNSVPDGIVIINNSGKIVMVNQQTLLLFGYEETELIDHEIEMLIPPKSREIHKKHREHFMELPERRLMGQGNDLLGLHKNGREFPVDISLSHFETDEGLFVSAAIRDVTVQKQASHYARSLIEATLDPLVTLNIFGKITDINEAMIKATDRTRKQLIGTAFKSYFVESEEANQVYKDVFKNGIVQNFPLTIIDGVLTDVLLNGSVYKDELGNVVGAVVVARDITELKQIEKELTEAKVMAELATVLAEEAKINAENATSIAEDAVKSKQQFLSNMSHEIRTPMNAIIGFTKVVLKTELSIKQKEYLTAIKLSGDALIVLINDILDLARVDFGQMTFEQIPFQLKLSISAMIHLFEVKISEKNLQLIVDYDVAIPSVLLGDSVRLHQIILNLVSNAVKFTSNGKIIVAAKMISNLDKSVLIEFSVSDTGIGITKNNLDRIFDNFQQASSETSRLYGGTGLGLAIVKQLVENQGGSVHVKSEIGVGSTFSFLLSFLKTDLPVYQGEIFSEDISNLMSIKVLVVEDIALNQLLMKTILDDFGFDRDIASNGLIAIEKLQKKSYDIILMDLQMPEMNGFETTDYIRNILHSNIPIIALTADVTTMDLEKCREVGMNDYLAKPLNEKLLYSKIVALVKKESMYSNQNDHVSFTKSPTKPTNIKCINLDYLKNLTKSDPKLMAEMIKLYLDQTPGLVHMMNQSFTSRNWKSLYDAVHKMIPSFLIMGISPDFENIAKIVQDFASIQLSEKGIPEMIKQLDNVCTQACAELQFDLLELEKINK